MLKYYEIIRDRLLAANQRRSILVIIKSAKADSTLNERVLWIKRVLAWIGSPVTPQGEVAEHRGQSIRVKLLIKILQENEDLRKPVTTLLTSVLTEVDPLDFFCDAGMVDSHAFFRELLVRVALRHLPAYRDFTNLSVLTEEVLKGEKSADWIETIDVKLLQELVSLLNFDLVFIAELRAKYRFSTEQATKILAARLASLSSIAEFRGRVPPKDRFLLINLAEHRSAEVLEMAQRVTEDVYQSLEGSGVSIELVFLLERMKGSLTRLQLLTALINDTGNLEQIKLVVCAILRAQGKKNSIVGFLSSNLRLIAKKIVERAGVSGENYIARTPKESRQLFLSAAGGGVLTVGTTMLKSSITKIGLPLFVEGCLAWLNYSLSFMFLQLAHLTLATKTPAMTAPALAAKLRDVGDFEAQTEFIQEVRHIFRSGLLAIVGNVVFVMLGAIGADLLFLKYKGSHTLSNESALHYLQAHHLFTSMTIWYAIYTGAALWLGSAIGGWFENWYTYRGLSRAVGENYFLQTAFGKSGANRLSHWLSHSIMGIATNVALGFLLAFSTIFGKFFGIPIDVRHVTLSSGTIGFSLMSLDSLSSNISLIVFSVSSIFIIGLLNFGVSFTISLFVAAQARGIQLSQYHRLFKNLFFRK